VATRWSKSFSRLDTIPACDGQTDRATDSQTPHNGIDRRLGKKSRSECEIEIIARQKISNQLYHLHSNLTKFSSNSN